MGDSQKFKAANLFPPKIFDATLSSKARPSFLRGDYDAAVFQAFKEVEVRVRKLSRATPEELGTTLMRDAFKPGKGPLSDPARVPAESQAISDLFAGAIGLFKNPGSHRDVDYEDPAEAAELIILADLLIRIAERRKPRI
ncbi:MAG: TIGR02391 family protein [Syntrophobacteraceae bacterium]|nr:TIGR02391 family protein [Syntrophobacteraceae bacterium]